MQALTADLLAGVSRAAQVQVGGQPALAHRGLFIGRKYDLCLAGVHSRRRHRSPRHSGPRWPGPRPAQRRAQSVPRGRASPAALLRRPLPRRTRPPRRASASARQAWLRTMRSAWSAAGRRAPPPAPAPRNVPVLPRAPASPGARPTADAPPPCPGNRRPAAPRPRPASADAGSAPAHDRQPRCSRGNRARFARTPV